MVVESAIDWAAPYSCTWRLVEVNADTWAGAAEVPGLVGVSITADKSGKLIESGNISLDNDGGGRGEFWGRVEALVQQGGVMERHAIGTFLLAPGSSTAYRDGTDASYDCSSVLRPAHDRVMVAGTYCASGSDAAAFAARLLRACTPAPIVAEGSFSLSSAYVFAGGTTYLDAAWQLVDAAGWRIRIDGDGTVRIGPMPQEPAMTIDEGTASLIGPSIGSEPVSNETPNRYIAVDGPDTAIATDDDPAHATSTRGRNGRFVDILDNNPKRVGGESLSAYASRKLAELAGVAGVRTASRAWVPGVAVFDVLRFRLRNGITGDVRISKQSLTLGSGIEVKEEYEVLR